MRLGLANSLLDRTEDGQTKVGLTSLLGRDTTDELGAVLESLLAVEGSGLAGEALADDARVLVDEEVLDGVLVRGARGGRREASCEGSGDEAAACLNMVKYATTTREG